MTHFGKKSSAEKKNLVNHKAYDVKLCWKISVGIRGTGWAAEKYVREDSWTLNTILRPLLSLNISVSHGFSVFLSFSACAPAKTRKKSKHRRHTAKECRKQTHGMVWRWYLQQSNPFGPHLLLAEILRSHGLLLCLNVSNLVDSQACRWWK